MTASWATAPTAPSQWEGPEPAAKSTTAPEAIGAATMAAAAATLAAAAISAAETLAAAETGSFAVAGTLRVPWRMGKKRPWGAPATTGAPHFTWSRLHSCRRLFRPLGFPIARPFLAVALGLKRPLDRVAADLP